MADDVIPPEPPPAPDATTTAPPFTARAPLPRGATAALHAESFPLVDVAARALKLALASFPQLLLLTLLFTAPMLWLDWRDSLLDPKTDAEHFTPMWLRLGVGLATGSVLQGLACGLALRARGGGVASLASAFALPPARMAPLVGIALVIAAFSILVSGLPLALLVATQSLLLAPFAAAGVAIACRLSAGWLVAVPVAMAERSGIALALVRSWSLALGHKWPLFALSLGPQLLAYAATWLAGKAVDGATDSSVLRFAVPEFANVLLTALCVLVPTVAYLELLRLRGEPEPERLEAIFE